jgi:hypothetical protein
LNALIQTLQGIAGGANVLHEGDLEAWEQDWRKRWRGKALAVVRPGSTSEVAAVVRPSCRKAATRAWSAARHPMRAARRSC